VIGWFVERPWMTCVHVHIGSQVSTNICSQSTIGWCGVYIPYTSVQILMELEIESVSRFSYTFDLERAANITWYWRLKTTVRDWLTKDDWHEKLHFIGLIQCFSKQTLIKILETGC
jgi:hypothetical protein